MSPRTFVTLLDPRFSPLRFNGDFERDFDTLFNDRMAPEYYEAEGHYLTSMDMPGVEAKDISIEVEENKVIINAERKKTFDKRGEQYMKYHQVFTLPKNTDGEKIEAHYENGVLNLAFPKVEEKKNRKKIDVHSGDKPKKWQSFLSFAKGPEKKEKEEDKKVLN